MSGGAVVCVAGGGKTDLRSVHAVLVRSLARVVSRWVIRSSIQQADPFPLSHFARSPSRFFSFF